MLENLNHYLKLWTLSDPHLIAQTATSHVYTVTSGGETVVLKLLTPLGEKDERFGAISLRHFNGRGAVRLLNEDPQALLMEYLEGGDLVPLVRSGGDEQATAIIGDVLNALHAAPLQSPPEGLRSLRSWFRALFDKAKQDRAAGLDTIFMRAATLADKVLSEPGDVYVLHGDIHHENVRYSAKRGWLAIDPKAIYGERTYDTANTLCNPYAVKEIVHDEARLLRNAGILAQKTGISLPRVLTFTYLYTCLSVSWSLEAAEEEPADYALRLANIVKPHIDFD